MSAHHNERDGSDTFLSRVFGLHSIYNQLADNYQYYDPDADSTVAQQLQVNNQTQQQFNHDSIFAAPLVPQSSHDKDKSSIRSKSGSNSNHLLDSESDSDLSSSSGESPNPIIAKLTDANVKKVNANSILNRSNANWNQESPSNLHDSSSSGPLLNEGKSGFKLPRIFPKSNKNHESELPLYNSQTTSFRRPTQSSSQQLPQSNKHLYQRSRKARPRFVIPPKERALYLWANITNMDEFLTDVYYYYRGKGLTNIVLTRIVDLLILIFVLGFTVFLKWGINYDYFFKTYKQNSHITLHDIIIHNFLYNEVPFSVKLLLFGFVNYVILRLVQVYFDFKYKLKEIKNFYKQLLNITNDNELLTISWSTIVERLMLLKDYNSLTSDTNNTEMHINDLNSKIRLNAHDIANRIMRMENYMIALMNKDILNLSVEIPMGNRSIPLLNNRSVLTKTLEWNLKLCINNFIFNQEGHINSKVLKEVNRNQLAAELTSRFKMAAIINLVLCPFIVIYFVLLYFFRYFNEYKSNPSSILGLRQYTPYAEWKLREFNELSHFFIRRLHLSIGPANTYINQFPRGFLVVNMMTLVNFISGAITAILVIMGLWFEDEDHSFWSFEITEGKSALFYISLFGSIWAVSAGSLNMPSTSSVSAENANTNTSSFVYDPEASLRYVSQFTHYLPSTWNGRLHTMEVKNEFCELYSLKIIIIMNEILSLIMTPFILWFKVSNNSGTIIDFFREYSIHVDGLGYICYYSMFNFEEKDKNMMYNLNKRKKHGKMKKKIYQPQEEVELDAIKPKIKIVDNDTRHIDKINENLIASEPDDDEDDEEEDNDDDFDPLYRDEKMIRSYMYFLESYGSKNQSSGKALKPPEKKLKPTRAADPTPSLLIPPNIDNQLTDSYTINYKFDEDEGENVGENGKKSGVFGMLNQFYKQDPNR